MQHTVHNSTQQIEAVYETHVPFVMCTIVVDRSLHWKSMTLIRYHQVWNILSDITQKIATSKAQKLLIFKENVGQMIRVGHSLYTLPVIRCCDWKHVKSWSRRDLDCWPLRKYVSDLSINNVQKCTVRKSSDFSIEKASCGVGQRDFNQTDLLLQYFTPWVRAWFDLDAIARELNVIQFFICQWFERVVTLIECKLNQQKFMFFLSPAWQWLKKSFANISW